MPLNTLFMGTPEYSMPTLKILYDHSNLKAIISSPDKIGGRGHKVLTPPPVEYAIQNQIPFLQPGTYKDNPKIIEDIQQFQPDLLIVIAYGFILPQGVLDIPKIGSFNLHASLLPKYRGASPIQAALLNGENETGVTLQKMVFKMDAGDIVLKKAIPIEENDDYITLSDKLSRLSASCLKESLLLFETNSISYTPQKEEEATYCKKIQKEDGTIDWYKSAKDIFNQIRALKQWPVAYSFIKNKKIFFHKSQLIKDKEANEHTLPFDPKLAKPGQVIKSDKSGLYIKTGQGIISVLELQAEGKKILTYKDFLNGFPLQAKDRFEVK